MDYVGFVNNMDWTVFVHDEYDEVYELPLCLDKVNHSPDGFSWGYGGSGPAQLAFAMLYNCVGEELARKHYQRFKSDVLAKFDMDQGFRLSYNTVRSFVELYEREQ